MDIYKEETVKSCDFHAHKFAVKFRALMDFERRPELV